MAHSGTDSGSVKTFTSIILYNLGRIFSYALVGCLFGLLGQILESLFTVIAPTMRIVAGLMMIALGLYLAGWWRGLGYLEAMGHKLLWRHLQPLAKPFMPITTFAHAFLLGMLWGWLPCGLVYSTLTLAATASDWQQSALIMASFGLGTAPVMLLSGGFVRQAKHWIQKSSFRQAAAVLIIGFGLWTLLVPSVHLLNRHPIHNHATLMATQLFSATSPLRFQNVNG